MATWLVDTLTRTLSKGTISNVSSEDNVTATTERGARTTNSSVVVTEDAGGQITFRRRQ